MPSPAKSHVFLSRAIRQAALTTVLLINGAGVAYAQDSTSTDPKIAIRAVQATLPSVAILGQKSGPGGTTEVYIQVPGVLNMQSVYVLGDGETVISGVVIPPIENGYPGAQLTLPDGNASVDPRSPRAGAQQISSVLGIEAPAVAGGQQRQTAADDGNFEVPPAPAMRASSTAQPTPAPSVAAADNSSGAAPSPQAGDRQASAANVGQLAESGGMLIESLSDVAESGAFSEIVAFALENDSDIGEIRAMAGTEGQKDGYLDLVKSLPAITQGQSDRKVYVMFDPNCPVCHRYYNEVQAMVNIGELQVNWIPAIVFPDNRSSLTSSAALLAETQREGGDPLGMLKNMMTQDGFNRRVDSSPNVDRLVPYLDAVVKATAVMAMARAETPLIVFESTGGELTISPGIPRTGYLEMIKQGQES